MNGRDLSFSKNPITPGALPCVLALPRSCRFHKSSPTSGALEVLDPPVPLQVLHQGGLLHEGLGTDGAEVVLDPSVDLLMHGSHVGESHFRLTAVEPASKLLLPGVSCHVGDEVVFVATVLSTL